MATPIRLEVTRARRRLQQAEVAVKELREQLEAQQGRVHYAKIRTLQAAEAEEAAAREALQAIDPKAE